MPAFDVWHLLSLLLSAVVGGVITAAAKPLSRAIWRGVSAITRALVVHGPRMIAAFLRRHGNSWVIFALLWGNLYYLWLFLFGSAPLTKWNVLSCAFAVVMTILSLFAAVVPGPVRDLLLWTPEEEEK